MNYRIADQRGTRALTRMELFVVLIIIFFVIILLFPGRSRHSHSAQWYCGSNLRQIGIAFRIWADDHGGSNPQAYTGDSNYPALRTIKWPTTGTPDAPADSPYTYLAFAVMSNELNTPKILVCPLDNRHARTNFDSDFIGPGGGHNSGVSYFAGRDAQDTNPQMFLTGDRNLCADTTVTPIPNHGYGISPDGSDRGAAGAFTTNYTRYQYAGWAPATMHQGTGNVGLADGSVQQFSNSGLVSGLKAAGTTNVPAQNYLLFP